MEKMERRQHGTLTAYRELGYYLKRLEQFEKAKAAFDIAYCHSPDNVRNLLGRSRVCANAIRPLQAYADAKLALELEPSNMTAVNVQAKAMYTMSEFEKSVVTNYRGAQTRRQPPYFKDGIIQGIQTIQDCIGTNAGNVLLDFYPLIKKRDPLSNKEPVINKPKHNCRIPQPQPKPKLTQAETRKYSTLSRVLAMKYLGPMAYDKFFLEKLINDRRLQSANPTRSNEVQDLVKQALNSLSESQQMLRQQRPYYTIKLAEKSESKQLNKFKKSTLLHERQMATRIADRFQNEIRVCLKSNRVKDLITRAERFQKFLDSKSKKVLPEKDKYIDRLYRNIGEAYLSQHRLSHKLSENANRRRIAYLMGLSSERPKSYDSVLANCPPRVADMKLVTEKVMHSLDVCESASMRCWLTYELARLLCLQKNYPKSKCYAKRCQREAQQIGSVAWWLNGCFVLLSGDMRQGNAGDVKLLVEEAYEWSKLMRDPELVQTFLFECARMASETVVPDDKKLIQRREKQIMSVMTEDERINAKVLYKRISYLPDGRRFSMLPSKIEQTVAQTKSERTRNKQTNLSVVAGVDRGIPNFPKSGVPGYQTFDLQ